MSLSKTFLEDLEAGRVPGISLQRLEAEFDPWVEMPGIPGNFSLRYPELAHTGTVAISFDLRRMKAMPFSKALNDVAAGKARSVHELLTKKKLLEHCLDINQLYALKSRGMNFLKRYVESFPGERISAWRSIAVDENGKEVVPCLIGDEHGDLEIIFVYLENELFDGPSIYYLQS